MSHLFSRIMKVLVVYLPFLIFGLFGMPLLLDLFKNIENDVTTRLTNLGFAIIAALAALCFSWNRSITGDTEMQEFTRKQGERSLLIAVMFLVCSGMKYFIVNIAVSPFLHPDIVKACHMIISPLLSIAIGLLLSLTFWILFRIALRLWEEFDFGKKWPG